MTRPPSRFVPTRRTIPSVALSTGVPRVAKHAVARDQYRVLGKHAAVVHVNDGHVREGEVSSNRGRSGPDGGTRAADDEGDPNEAAHVAP
ncbi:MAG TPA: hypothetical protein VES88_17615 [Gemmatimonadaceae bacterium]|nr:hypothetical protein [Gemmatimonadaceae bacterium]